MSVAGGSALATPLRHVVRGRGEPGLHGRTVDRFFEAGFEQQLVLFGSGNTVDLGGDVSPVDDDELG